MVAVFDFPDKAPDIEHVPDVRRRLDGCFRAFTLIRCGRAPPRTHSTDAVLDAARAIVLRDGARAATVAAIARVSGAPRARSTTRSAPATRLLTAAWERAARRSQAAWVAGRGAARTRSRPGRRWRSRCSRSRASNATDCRLLLGMRLEDLVDGPAPDLRDGQRARGRDRRRARPPDRRARPPASALPWPPSTSPTARSGAGCWAANRRHAALDGPVAAAVRAILTHDQELPR